MSDSANPNFEISNLQQSTSHNLSVSFANSFPLLCKEGSGEVDYETNLTRKSSKTPSKLVKISSFVYRNICNPRFLRGSSLIRSFNPWSSFACTSPSTSITIDLSGQ